MAHLLAGQPGPHHRLIDNRPGGYLLFLDLFLELNQTSTLQFTFNRFALFQTSLQVTLVTNMSSILGSILPYLAR